MFAICLECSHQKGMGHLFRALNFIRLLHKKKVDYCVLLNDDTYAISILRQKKILFETVDLNDFESNWETRFIQKYNFNFWINDRLATERAHTKNVKRNNIRLIHFDDDGDGAELADVNFGMMPCNYEIGLKGRENKKGVQYFILNEEINMFIRERRKINKIIVSLGGSDTYGVTLLVAEALKKAKIPATIITGPSFQHKKKLDKIADETFVIKNTVPSLPAEFYNYDLAITGGGITPFEANAAGLPSLIIANEQHEIANGKFLESIGSSSFMGYYTSIDFAPLLANQLDILSMSQAGLKMIQTNGAENVYNQIL